jgi:hypothetical protein
VFATRIELRKVEPQLESAFGFPHEEAFAAISAGMCDEVIDVGASIEAIKILEAALDPSCERNLANEQRAVSF